MAGWLYFGGQDGVSLGSSAIDFIASYLRPYIAGVSTEVLEKVYETYDLFDDILDFSALPSKDYMHCYSQLLTSFETDLAAVPIINGKSRQWAIGIWHLASGIWHDEIKPKMQASPLYNSDLLDK